MLNFFTNNYKNGHNKQKNNKSTYSRGLLELRSESSLSTRRL